MRYVLLLLALAAITTASALDFFFNFDVGGEAQAWAPVIEQGLPLELGPWVGQEVETDDKTLVTAGAVGKVNRVYRHKDTGEVVSLWLIVGHMQQIVRHPPTVCYPNQQFKRQEKVSRYSFEGGGPDKTPNEFWTTWFSRSLPGEVPQRRRVFWAWCKPEQGKLPEWQAPGTARFEFPGAKALFKMYFTTDEPEDVTSLADNPSNDFASYLLPVVAGLLESGPEGYGATEKAQPSQEVAAGA